MTDKYLYSINGIISRTVVSNDLVVAIQNFDGTDFSAGSPLVHKIGDTPRTLTGALSVTVPHGTGTFNGGAVEFASKEIDYFVYLGWRASNSSVFIIVSRIPYAKTYADFSSTVTNEKYGAYSGATPASTDPVVNIGRFNATNSGSASYNWSVPATSVVVNYPIFETRWLVYAPVSAGFSVDPTDVATYKVEMNNFWINVRDASAGTSNATTYTKTLPFTSRTVANLRWMGTAAVSDNSAVINTPGVGQVQSNSNLLELYTNMSAGVWTAGGTKQLRTLTPMLIELGQ